VCVYVCVCVHVCKRDRKQWFQALQLDGKQMQEEKMIFFFNRKEKVDT